MDKTMEGASDVVETVTSSDVPATNEGQAVTNEADLTASQKAADGAQKEVDYEALLAEERRLRDEESAARKKAEDKIVEMKRAQKQSKTEGFEEDDSEIPDVEVIVEKKLAEREAKLRNELARDSMESELEKLSSNEKERELIKFHYENTIRTTGIDRLSIRRDLERAALLANQGVAQKKLSEMKEAIISKKTAKNTSAGNNQDIDVEVETKFTPQELAILKRVGVDPKTVKK